MCAHHRYRNRIHLYHASLTHALSTLVHSNQGFRTSAHMWNEKHANSFISRYVPNCAKFILSRFTFVFIRKKGIMSSLKLIKRMYAFCTNLLKTNAYLLLGFVTFFLLIIRTIQNSFHIEKLGGTHYKN